jgi:transcriptional regulator with XRE-family HTH domain
MEHLKRLRDAAGLSQDELAEKLGMSRYSIISYENGKTSPSLEVLKKIAQALHCSLFDLVAENPTTLPRPRQPGKRKEKVPA